MELHAPKISIVRDAHDRAIVFVDIRFGYKETIVRVAPAFQSAVLAGGSVTVHLDTHLRRFIIASQSMKGLLKAETCHHVIDLPGQSRHSYALKAHEHVKAGENMKADKNTKAHEHIKRPKNSWIIYRSEKSKFLHKNNPGMSAGDICKLYRALNLVATEVILELT